MKLLNPDELLSNFEVDEHENERDDHCDGDSRIKPEKDPQESFSTVELVVREALVSTGLGVKL